MSNNSDALKKTFFSTAGYDSFIPFLLVHAFALLIMFVNMHVLYLVRARMFRLPYDFDLARIIIDHLFHID